MALTVTEIQQLYTAYLGRPADREGLEYWQETDLSAAEIRTFLANDDQPEYVELYGDRSREELVQAIYENMFGREADEEGLEYWVNGDGAAVPASELQQLFIEAASEEDRAAFDAQVAADVSDIPPAPVDGEAIRLTQQADNLEGTAGDDAFAAPVTQNETGSGALANTFETGDVLNGGEGTDTLRADLIATGTIQDNFAGAAISAETTSIENVFLRAQAGQADFIANNTTFASTIDAEKMSGVEQWWTDGSRANISIEDIRSATQDTTFGMRATDPGVSYQAYFNPLFLDGGNEVGASAFNFVIRETNDVGAELQDIAVTGVRFELNGESYELGGADVEAANTWAELQTALQADIDTTEGLAGLTVEHSGNGQFVVTDPNAGDFVINPVGTVASISTTQEEKAASLGVPQITNLPTETDVVLDGAGGGSQGGALNIAANSGGRGVEVFNVTVDRDSHLSSMSSVNGAPFNGLVPNEYLEVVNLANADANGDLQVGTRSNNIDGRSNTNGLTNVREVNAEGFAGDLNIGLSLDNNTITRYLDDAEEAVEFNYTAGNGNDLFNIFANAVVSGDQDFAMNVDMGAGDDRLVINVPVVRAASVDGGEGENSIVVSQSHGTNASNTFEEFANFQTYEVEGGNNTAHNFTSMSGVEDVTVATNATVNTQLINMEADQSVTVSGKNQTSGNNSTADQFFGNVQLTNDQGADRTVTLDNTARLANSTNGVRQDGVLTVNNVTVNSNSQLDGTSSAVRNLTIDSSGERSSANAIAQLNAATVTSLNLVGTQDLSLNIESLSNQNPASAQTALDVDASDLSGNLSLAIDGDQLATIAGNGTDTVVGTAGDSDTLMVHGGISAGDELNATAFETMQFGTQGTSLYGDLSLNGPFGVAASGTFNAASVTANTFNVALSGGLTLDNLGSGAVVNLGDANRDAAGDVVNGQDVGGAVTLISGADTGTAAARNASVDVNFLSVLGEDDSQVLNTQDYGTINIDVNKAADSINGGVGTADTRNLTLNLDGDARNLDIDGGDVNGVNASGVYDSLTLVSELPNSMSEVDLSGYAGEVNLTMEQGVLAAQTDVRFVMSENDANVVLSNDDGTAAGVEHNSIFEFTGDKGSSTDVSTWTITNAFGFDEASVDTNNATVLDVSVFGITGYADLDIEANGGNARIVSEAQNDNNAETWEIILTGVNAADVTEENFTFA